MKPAAFDYACPATLDEALAILADSDTDPVPLAGGQSLVPMMNFRIARPGMLVDLNRVAGLSGLAAHQGRVRIGAMTRYRELAPAIRALPLVGQALRHIAHPAIRNRGTIGGSLALADPAAELPAVALALGAVLHLASAKGGRDVAADDFFLGAYATALDPGELLTAVTFPAATEADRFGFFEIARRHGDYALAGAAVARTSTGTRIALFGVGDGALRARASEARLDADPSDIRGAVAAMADVSIAGDMNGGPETKRHIAGVALTRALEGMAL